MSADLSGMRVAIVVTDMFEEAELVEPRQALDDAGAITQIISPKEGDVLAANHFNKGELYPVDATLEEIAPTDFDAILLPGGALNADMLRVEPRAQRLVQQMNDAGKPIAVICHGAWLLVSSGVVDGRQLTSFHTIADDIRNAGGEWTDAAVVVDQNIVSSRTPEDIPQFIEAMLVLFEESFEPDSAELDIAA